MEDVKQPLLQETRIDVGGGRSLRDPNSNSIRLDLDCGGVCGLTEAGGVGGAAAQERKEARRKLVFAIVLCVLFMFVEVVGGILANSLAVLTDAAHLLSDVAGFAISLAALWMSGWEATPTHTFGFHRMEILGALVSMQLIWALTGVLVYEAIVRMLYVSRPVDGRLMFCTAALGVAVNVLMTLVLGHHHGHSHGGGSHSHSHSDSHSHSHSHSDSHSHSSATAQGGGSGHSHPHSDAHNHSHSPSPSPSHSHPRAALGGAGEAGGRAADGVPVPEGAGDQGRLLRHSTPELLKKHSEQNINLKGAYLHVLGDLVQSVGVMVGGLVIWAKPEWKVVDLICTLLFSVLVLATTVRMLQDVIGVLMESTPKAIDAAELEDGIRQIDTVIDVHELHIWAITMGKIVLACHVRILPAGDTSEVLQKVLEFCEKRYGITHATVQVERDIEREDGAW